MDQFAFNIPCDLNLEQICIARLLQDSNLFASVDLSSADFFLISDQVVFQIARDMHTSGHKIDATSVADALRATNQLEEFGGVEWVDALFKHVPVLDEQSLELSARRLRKMRHVRRYMQLARIIGERVPDEEEKPFGQC